MSDNPHDDPRLAEAVRESAEYEALLLIAGWKRLAEVLAEQIQTRRDRFELVPLASLDGALEQEFLKGEIAGLRTFLGYPAQMREIARETIEQLTANEEDTDDGPD